MPRKSNSATGCRKGRSVPYHLKADPGASAPPLAPGIYRVRVYSGSSPRLTAFALVDITSQTESPAPESGFWWTQSDGFTASAAGTGMNLEVQDNQLAASLLGLGPRRPLGGHDEEQAATILQLGASGVGPLPVGLQHADAVEQPGEAGRLAASVGQLAPGDGQLVSEAAEDVLVGAAPAGFL